VTAKLCEFAIWQQTKLISNLRRAVLPASFLSFDISPLDLVGGQCGEARFCWRQEPTLLTNRVNYSEWPFCTASRSLGLKRGLSATARRSSSQAYGLRARIVTHRPNFLKVAETFVRHPPAVRYLMNPTARGTVSLARLSGGGWKLRMVEAALAKVVTLEAERAELLASRHGSANSSPLTARRSSGSLVHA